MFQVGTTSYVLKVRLSNYITKELLGEFYLKFVHINGNSRRPQPLPDWYVSRFADIVENQGRLPTMPSVPDMPEDAYSTTVLTRFSDLDTNQHVTTIQYFKFFTDCATEAVFTKYYTHFTHDMCWYPVMAFDEAMLGESKAGEILTVRTWQDKSDATHVFFACFKDWKCVMKALCSQFNTKGTNTTI
ncbi:hypothetical protein KP79_PYT26193 [Mizuhopecten yessoensis]|uniref:Acyl-ACP thioesterase-like C-terminal domain-containing protein n=1 Tax=Mizuhopecten yessoensis TaxID=6573 RepID=A0A210QEV4_MIZYE|nr:hypothetical protein KP79_PYT26193 [Mizuhopecten yessoensis]